jgi:hypothetical protein
MAAICAWIGARAGEPGRARARHGRPQHLHLPGQGHGVTWAQRTPQIAPALAHELAAGLDDRRRELGEQALENPGPWLTRHLGAPPGPDASPVLREDYAWRAGTAAAYREARGITDPEQAVSLDPHPEPELEALRRDTVRALEIAGEQAELRAMSRGELEGRSSKANARRRQRRGYEQPAAPDLAGRRRRHGSRDRTRAPGRRQRRPAMAARCRAHVHLGTDVQFGATRATIGDYVRHDEPHPTDFSVETPWYSLECTFTLEPGAARLPRPPIK